MPGWEPSQSRAWIGYVLAVSAVAFVARMAQLDGSQIVASTVFAGIIFGAIFFWAYRLAFALAGLSVMLMLGVIDVKSVIAFAGLDIILFLVGMMIVVGFLEERQFFEHIVDAVVARVGKSGRRLAVALMVMAAVSASLVDEVTSILFMAATVFNITTRLGQRPLPLLMMVVFATNIGSSATVVGNPVGVMIALRGGLTFNDFLWHATPIAVVSLLLTIAICLVLFRSYIQGLDAALRHARTLPVEAPRRNFRGLLGSAALLGGVLAGLVLHTRIEALLGLEKNAMLLGVALLGAAVALVATGRRARELVERRVDWWTLSFFLILFASVGALQLTSVTSELAHGVERLAGDDPTRLLVVFMTVAGVLSALMDNVLAVAMFIPVVEDLGASGTDNFPLWWAMLFAGTFLGNLTMMGSTANIVALGMMERRGLDAVTFWGWLRYGLVVAVPTFLLAMGLLWLRFYA